ncbi:hypothetical protein [Neolewinella lacunae]|uniref:hypothetical protein n=1 Tax=Neolewinella lacunae TaxID=1517758 RepID=UPI001CA46295|nr:hypothetical protein [Neolewinella lacunae]
MKIERNERTTQVLVNIEFRNGCLQSPKSQNLGCWTIVLEIILDYGDQNKCIPIGFLTG